MVADDEDEDDEHGSRCRRFRDIRCLVHRKVTAAQADPRALADDGLSPYTAAILKEALIPILGERGLVFPKSPHRLVCCAGSLWNAEWPRQWLAAEALFGSTVSQLTAEVNLQPGSCGATGRLGPRLRALQKAPSQRQKRTATLSRMCLAWQAKVFQTLLLEHSREAHYLIHCRCVILGLL